MITAEFKISYVLAPPRGGGLPPTPPPNTMVLLLVLLLLVLRLLVLVLAGVGGEGLWRSLDISYRYIKFPWEKLLEVFGPFI